MGPWPIPQGFEQLVREHLRRTRGEERGHLVAGDFPPGQSVRLSFPDGSFASFEYAFPVEDRDRQRVAVFTEHCGHHVFPSGDLSIAVVHATTSQDGAGAKAPSDPTGRSNVPFTHKKTTADRPGTIARTASPTFEDFVRALRAVPSSGNSRTFKIPTVSIAQIEEFAGMPDLESFDEFRGIKRMRWRTGGYTFVCGILRDGTIEQGLLYRGTPNGSIL